MRVKWLPEGVGSFTHKGPRVCLPNGGRIRHRWLCQRFRSKNDQKPSLARLTREDSQITSNFPGYWRCPASGRDALLGV